MLSNIDDIRSICPLSVTTYFNTKGGRLTHQVSPYLLIMIYLKPSEKTSRFL
ncbi:hypothetical protein B6254_0872 [Weissella cibaria]|uniref:Uncharacterized protein n=1 Tax=Weissella cibaria TaxID=137591 RepID=A0A2S1KQI5_9LACO|nr:hypothetical protein B6254_0872 [Weissella cibaria]